MAGPKHKPTQGDPSPCFARLRMTMRRVFARLRKTGPKHKPTPGDPSPCFARLRMTMRLVFARLRMTMG